MPRFAALALALSLLAQLREANACSVSPLPYASVVAVGHRPWIRIGNLKPSDAIKVTIVAGSCDEDKVCVGTPVAIDRAGSYLRPKQALADGARVQVTFEKTVLEDFVVAASTASELPAWDGTQPATAAMVGEGLCNPRGPAIELQVKPTAATLDGAVLLVYLSAPDPARPHAKIASVESIGANRTITLQSSLAHKWLPNTMPKKIWVALADGEGHVGPAVAHVLTRR